MLSNDELRARLITARDGLTAILEALVISDIVTVKAGGNLQAALDAGGTVQLEAATYSGPGFVISKPGTKLIGNAAKLVGVGRPALSVLPGVSDVQIANLSAVSDADTVFRLGAADGSQTRIEQVPRDLVLVDVSVPMHRRKRAFAVHAANVVMERCSAVDIYDASTSYADSQALWIHNTPGNITVVDFTGSAGSEGVLVGGDPMVIPNLIPSGLNFQRLHLFRPLSWKTDGIKRKVKNLFELKNGQNVRVENSTFDGCWYDREQQAFALVLTPRHQGGIRNVTFDNIRARNVGGLVNILGENDTDTQGPTPFKTSEIVFRGGSAQISKAQYGGYGSMVLSQRGCESLTFDRFVCVNDGSKLIDIADKVPHGALNLWDSAFTSGLYSVSIAGRHNLSTPFADPLHPELGGVRELKLSNLTFADAPAALKKNYPTGQYVTRAQFDALPLVQEALK